MFKKAASFILVLAMAFSVPLPIDADEDQEEISYVYEADVYLEEDDPAIRAAGDEMRANFVKRMTSFDITLDSKKKYLALELFNAIYNHARIHTGNPNEGDYLYHHIAKSGGLAKRKIEGEGDNAIYHYTVSFKMEYLTDAAQEDALAKALQQVYKELELEDKSDVQKIEALYDYLVKHAKQAQESDDRLNDSAYGAFIASKATSEGFASLFYRMMLENGIDCRVVEGEYNKTPETWNIVKVMDAYYYIDAYLDAGKQARNYLLKGSKSLVEHSLANNYKTEEFKSLYPISSTDYPLENKPDDSQPAYTLNHETLELRVGDSATLVPSWQGAISWVSTDAKVASVSNGTVKAKSPGTAEIFAYTGTNMASCTVTVTEEPAHPEFGFADIDGKKYWYEGNVRQGDMNDQKNVKDAKDGYIRGREIFDPASDGWYWLDAAFNGAAAFGKEVWMPYIYQEEDNCNDEVKWSVAQFSDEGMRTLVYNAMKNKDGKWVRYDNDGKMLKGWVEIKDTLAELYPDQKGNVYYYDTITGLMAKGNVTIAGRNCYFDPITGVLQK